MNHPVNVQVTAFTPALFLALSSGLTGVSVAQLNPANCSINAAGRFFEALERSLPPETLSRMAQTFLNASSVTEGAAEVLVDPKLAQVGRSIIELWLTGIWHDPSDAGSAPRTVCDDTYRQCAAWRILQAHPMHELLAQPGKPAAGRR